MNAHDQTMGSNMGLRISTQAATVHIPGRLTREADLMIGFEELKRSIRDVDDVLTIPLPNLLLPFLAIIQSPLSTGPITSKSLSALHSFFVSGIICPDSIELEKALSQLSSAVSHCRFEASDSSGDEVVLSKIMIVIQDCFLDSRIGNLLGDVEVCEMLETVLTTCCQMRLSEILRRSAENIMQNLVRAVFSRLHSLDPALEEAKVSSKSDDSEGEVKMSLSTQEALDAAPADQVSVAPTQEGENDEQLAPVPSVSAPHLEYGLPCILELLRVLINVLDPSDQQHTDSTRLVALAILNSAFEEAGPRIPDFPSLEALVIDPGCKFMFQLARSESPAVLQNALRTISTIFDTLPSNLKLQQELFLTFTFDRLTPPPLVINKAQHITSGTKQTASPRPGTPSTPLLAPLDVETDGEKGNITPSRIQVAPAKGETRELLLETLTLISRRSSFMVDLYSNYDCDVNCENVFERFIDFLTKAVYPSHYRGPLDVSQKNAQFLCLDLLLAFVNDMAARADGAADPWPTGYPTPESLLQNKSQKKLILTGASRFNTKPKTGIAFLEEHGLIDTDAAGASTHEQSLAKFLKSCTRLDKRLLGDFISKPENIEILKAFIGLFDFKDKPIADAMRELLETFRLPGEAQQIARITETFASIYFASKPAEIKSEDAVYVLAYSVIMLNTDLHNPQVRKRMSIEEYQKNLRGVNDGSDFSPEYLQAIYDSIRKREIVMPEEHTGQLGFEYAWKELLTRSRQSGSFIICNTSLFDVEMFKTVWKPVITAIAYAFITFDDDYIIQRSVAGFRQCATLAGHFRLPDVFDFVVVSLSQATSLLSDSLSSHVPNYPVVDVEGQTVTISNLSVRFGTNLKGQLAAVVLFNIVNGNGNALREGWTQIFEMFQNLFVHSLLPTRMLQMEDFLGGVSMIPLRGGQTTRQPTKNEGGLLSTLSSYLMTPYGASSDNLVPEVTDAHTESTMCTIDCITSCRLDELYAQIMNLELDALVAAIKALEALAHERTVLKLKQEGDEANQTATGDLFVLPYDPASVFLLETMVSIACQTTQYIEDVWPVVFEHLRALLSTSAQYSILLIERAVVGLFRLCLILASEPTLRDQVYVAFDLVACLPPDIASSVAEQTVTGVTLMLQKHRDTIRSQTEWNLIFALLRSTIHHAEASRQTFELITSLAADGPDQHVVVDNLPGFIIILDEFISAATAVAAEHQQKSRTHEPLTAAKSSIVQRGVRGVDLLVNLKRFIEPLNNSQQIPQDKIWHNLCLPLLSSLSRQCSNASREVRAASITQLQRLLLGSFIPFTEPSHATVEEIFYRIVFPILDDLLKPTVYQRDPLGIPETRLRASALLCRTFMHYEVTRNDSESDIRLLWIQVLDLLDRMMNTDRDGQLHEAIPESLKNVLLVMNATQILVRPSTVPSLTERQKTMWTATHERLERFLPGFLGEVIQDQPPQPLQPEVTST